MWRRRKEQKWSPIRLAQSADKMASEERSAPQQERLAMEQSDVKIIRKMLAQEKLDAEAVLAKLVELLVRDHLADRAKANGGAGTTAINHPTTLWHVEKVIAEELR